MDSLLRCLRLLLLHLDPAILYAQQLSLPYRWRTSDLDINAWRA